MSGERVVYKLKHPVNLTSKSGEVIETITELKLRRLKGRDMAVTDKAKGGGTLLALMLAASADLPPSTVDELDYEDITDAGVVIAGFAGGYLPTGEK